MSSWGLRGAAAMEEAARSVEVAKQRKQRKEFNFKLSPSESAEIVVLDETLDHAFGLWEQTIPGPNPVEPWKGSVTFISPKSKGLPDPMEEQPLLNGRKTAAKFVLYLSVLSLKPFTNAQGVVYPHTRMLLPIKAGQKDDILRKFKKRQDKNGKLRGLHLQMIRGSDPKSASIGSPEELEDGEWGFLTEAQLIERFGHPDIKNQAGQVVAPANSKIQAIKYEDYFIVETPESVRRMFNLGAPSNTSSLQGSSQDWGSIASQDVGDVPEFLTEDDIPF